ncbi:MAG TPA: pyruvate kinase, partial [Ignisphaera sp.]|nr:pyruvate kinase [Ignisphaera sp.]
LGPSSKELDIIERMIRAGASGFRINFAHGFPDEWEKMVNNVRTAESSIGKAVALIGDLQGPSVRVGKLHKPLLLKRGESARIILSSESEGGEKKTIPIPVEKFFETADVGDLLVMDDGKVRLHIVDKRGSDELEVVSLTNAVITTRKAVVIQGKDLDLPTLSMQDLENLKFAINHDFDYIALSYVRKAEDIELLRETLRRFGKEDIGIIAKIETRSAIHNLSDIIDVSDVILIARGDLGMNFSLEEVHRYQKYIADKCLELGKPVIVATQLLESMIENPVPTRAEVVDISVAVEQGVDALMLTGETSIGKYPVEAISWLYRITSYAEKHLLKKSIERIISKARTNTMDLPTRFAKGVLELAEDIGAKLLVFSMHGNTARRLSILKPMIHVYVATPNIKVMRRLAILWGIRTFKVEAPNYEEGLEKALQRARELNLINYGDITVATYGLREPKQRIEIFRLEPQ